MAIMLTGVVVGFDPRHGQGIEKRELIFQLIKENLINLLIIIMSIRCRHFSLLHGKTTWD